MESSTPTRYRGWTRPGPLPPGGVEAETGETLDYISGNFRIFQYEKGHRFSTDDLLVAWWGTAWVPRAARVLDLGSGIGSVALVVAWRLPQTRVVAVEAQELSVRLVRKSVAYNGLGERFRIVPGDLRDERLLSEEEPFDLVLGTPPYWSEGTATEAANAQAVPARIEVRGDVRDYAAAAARSLAPGGLFALVFPASRRAVSESALAAAGLLLLRRRDVVFKEGEPPALTLFAAVLHGDYPAALRGDLPVVDVPLVIRRRDGSRHPEWAATRYTLGFPPGGAGDDPD